MKTYLARTTVIDGTGAEPLTDATVVLEGERISEVRSGADASADARDEDRVVDASGHFVMPGLWSAHCHLGFVFPDVNHVLGSESIADYTIRAGRNAMDALRLGITSLRTVGDRDYVDVAWKRAFRSGLMRGPDLFVSGHYLCATGGHAYDWPGAIEIDGSTTVRRVVREQLKHGADHIKLAVTGGVATAGESMQECQLLEDEIRTAVRIAHEKGAKVCVHAGGPGGVKASVRAGVDVIEHGYYLDDEAVDLMAEHDVAYVPTLFVTQHEDFMRRSGMKDFQIAKAQTAALAHRTGFRKALAAGVRIGCGADSSPIGDHTIVELTLLARHGMAPMQALMAATRNVADICGVLDDVGTVTPGRRADLLVLREDPLQDVANVRSLEAVYKRGQVVDLAGGADLTDMWTLFMQRRD